MIIYWPAVVACVVFSMVSGSLWYHPKTFFDIWWKAIGKTAADDPGDKISMAIVWTLTILSEVFLAVAMALAVFVAGKAFGAVTVGTGLLTALFLWLGFIAPTYLVNKLFAGHGIKVWAIETGNHLVNLLVFGAILGGWR